MCRFHWKHTVVASCCLFISGCSAIISLQSDLMHCDVKSELLTTRCPNPTPITNGSTFATLVDAMRADRQALRECGISFNALRDAIDSCNRSADEINKRISEINSREMSIIKTAGETKNTKIIACLYDCDTTHSKCVSSAHDTDKKVECATKKSNCLDSCIK